MDAHLSNLCEKGFQSSNINLALLQLKESNQTILYENKNIHVTPALAHVGFALRFSFF